MGSSLLSCGEKGQAEKTCPQHFNTAVNEQLLQRLHSKLVMQMNQGDPSVQVSSEKVMRSEPGWADQVRHGPAERKQNQDGGAGEQKSFQAHLDNS